MSTLKHNIRQQQAQLHNLENTLLRGPRPLPPGVFNSPPMSPDELDDPPSSSGRSHSHNPSTASSSSYTTRMQRRSSYEVLAGMAGPDSSLPLPKANGGARRSSFGEDGGIKEGIPVTSPTKRVSSPTRTLSRTSASLRACTPLTTRPSPQEYPFRPSVRTLPLCYASLARVDTSAGHARALAEEASDPGLGSSISSLPPVSPNKRASFAPGNTTKVLADLQAGVLNAKNALENTKSQLRLSQRQVSQLTRQTEDLKEVRERLRLENEGLNNVVARKERLLQEVRTEHSQRYCAT